MGALDDSFAEQSQKNAEKIDEPTRRRGRSKLVAHQGKVYQCRVGDDGKPMLAEAIEEGRTVMEANRKEFAKAALPCDSAGRPILTDAILAELDGAGFAVVTKEECATLYHLAEMLRLSGATLGDTFRAGKKSAESTDRWPAIKEAG